jgi:hypothetical protein
MFYDNRPLLEKKVKFFGRLLRGRVLFRSIWNWVNGPDPHLRQQNDQIRIRV